MTGQLLTVSSYGRGGSSARVRIFDWLDHLGVRAETHDYLGGSDNGLRSTARGLPAVLAAERRLRSLPNRVGSSTVLMSRRASPFSRGGVEARLLSAAARGVYDFDDALHLPRGGVVGRLFPAHEQWGRAVGAADSVIAGNEWLAEAASRHARDVVVIPSCVEPGSYVRKASYERAGVPSAVWLGSPSTEAYLGRVTDALLTAHAATGLRLTVISGGRGDLGALTPMADRVPWALDTFARRLAEADFGIMPLDDDAWARGKCAYKLLQYGAAGLPMIGDPIGANGRALALTGGLAPTSPSEWTDALIAMAELPASLAEQQGAQARRAVEEHYSFAAWRTEWRAAVGMAHVARQ
jgi:glycosyltransferase involved in cell wall biosynthesis